MAAPRTGRTNLHRQSAGAKGDTRCTQQLFALAAALMTLGTFASTIAVVTTATDGTVQVA